MRLVVLAIANPGVTREFQTHGVGTSLAVPRISASPVLVGTIFHGSKIPLRTWLFVIVEIVASSNGAFGLTEGRRLAYWPLTNG